ncbi:glycosyltransferase family 2 protein [Mucilaginibacter flavidus]|uniref:glycosyltransferase family 2 protein n=1 Tax=Mucilaginibacter flavidus TaxID=2949309 RepID=UPI002092F207|nr:glycosyltransferase [Mucilaginibacter flavidus]MCO5947682.1 glycosyltransferase [Mucilaginibacter flavidus]
MARCKIYIFTYKRNHLLPRAVQSLIGQHFKDWICEVHNDCPEDMFPSQYVESLNDPRFFVKNHSRNLGATASFNLAFKDCEEDYVSILEDDNWWEPDFLTEMIFVMDKNPTIKIAWSNMRIWKEEANDQWVNTCATTWPVNREDSFFDWPDFRQAMGALHSNGAMLYRGKFAKKYTVPDTCDFSMMESARERTFEFPIYLKNKPLANFSQTLQTNRSEDPLVWTNCQLMLLGSFIQASGNQKKTFCETLLFYRRKKPSPVANFFLVTIFILKDASFMKCFSFGDWLIFIRWLLKNGLKLSRLKRKLRSGQDVYDRLLSHTIHLNQSVPHQSTR